MYQDKYFEKLKKTLLNNRIIKNIVLLFVVKTNLVSEIQLIKAKH